jgi:hypothetical protein
VTGPFDPIRGTIYASLPDFCEEIREWHDTAILRDGKVREAARSVAHLVNDDSHRLQIVEGLVNEMAMRYVLEHR